MSLLHEETTGKIIGAYYKVYSNLITQAGCSKENDVKALGIEMRQRGLKVREQYFFIASTRDAVSACLFVSGGRLRESAPVKLIWR